MGAPRNHRTRSDRPASLARDAKDGILVLGGNDIRTLLTPKRCLAALESMYADLHACPDDRGRSLGFATGDGKIHVKAGLSPRSHAYFAAKINANYPDNPVRFGLPTIQGVVVLADCRNGRPVALLDSATLTGLRTAAATALAARHGARRDARRLAIIGCGEQARYQAEAMLQIRPIAAVSTFDRSSERASAFASWARRALGVPAEQRDTIEEAVRGSDICVTCTTSRRPILSARMLPPGCFVAAVGTDNPDKQEIDADVFAGARIIVDDLEQCAGSGDLAHALRAGSVTADDVAATLAELAAGKAEGRVADGQIVLFDSTGTGVQDVAAGAAAYEQAVRSGHGQLCCL